MEPERFLTHAEFNALLKAAKDDREICILLLLAGAGLRVSEKTQIRAEDVDFSKGYLHVPAINAKFKKSRTVILLPQVAKAVLKQLAGRTKGWLFPSYRDSHITSRRVQNILDNVATEAGLQEVKRQDKAGKNRHRIHPTCSGIASPSGTGWQRACGRSPRPARTCFSGYHSDWTYLA